MVIRSIWYQEGHLLSSENLNKYWDSEEIPGSGDNLIYRLGISSYFRFYSLNTAPVDADCTK